MPVSATALRPFANEPLTDFARPENRDAFERALDLVRSQLGRSYPLVIAGENVTTDDANDAFGNIVSTFAPRAKRL